MNSQVQTQQIINTNVQAQWIQYITPIIVGVMFLVFIAGMIRDLFRGEEVKLP